MFKEVLAIDPLRLGVNAHDRRDLYRPGRQRFERRRPRGFYRQAVAAYQAEIAFPR